MSALQTQTAPEDSALIFRNIGKSKTTVILQVHTYTHTHAFLETHSHIPCIHTHTPSHTHTHTCTHALAHIHMHTHPLSHTQTCAHTPSLTHTNVCTHTLLSLGCCLWIWGPPLGSLGAAVSCLHFQAPQRPRDPPARELRTRASGPDEWLGH